MVDGGGHPLPVDTFTSLTKPKGVHRVYKKRERFFFVREDFYLIFASYE